MQKSRRRRNPSSSLKGQSSSVPFTTFLEVSQSIMFPGRQHKKDKRFEGFNDRIEEEEEEENRMMIVGQVDEK